MTESDPRSRSDRLGRDRLGGLVGVVTGAASGMGLATTRQCISEGARVVMVDQNEESLSVAAGEFGESCESHDMDVGSEAAWMELEAALGERYGQIDFLVNNAGISLLRPLVDTSALDFERVIRVNETGTFLGIRTAAKLMATSGGSIVNIGSVASLRGIPGNIAYAASKSAVRGMTKTAAGELSHLGIRVNAVHPGVVDTPMVNKGTADLSERFTGMPIGRLARAEEIAMMVAFLVSPDSSYCTGGDFVVDGGATAVAPQQWSRRD